LATAPEILEDYAKLPVSTPFKLFTLRVDMFDKVATPTSPELKTVSDTFGFT
jgi:hypothetical protein